MADPALAARLLDIGENRLFRSAAGSTPGDGFFLGFLFEALVVLSLQTYAQANEASVSYLRSADGSREVDFIVHKGHAETIAFEVKLTKFPTDGDVKNLLWLKEKMGDQLVDMAVITTGERAYRRPDGVAVIPLALLRD